MDNKREQINLIELLRNLLAVADELDERLANAENEIRQVRDILAKL